MTCNKVAKWLYLVANKGTYGRFGLILTGGKCNGIVAKFTSSY